MAEIVVRRASTAWQDRYRAFKVFVDGERRGSIASGSELGVEVAPGTHAVQLKLDWCSSPIVEIEVAANKTKIVDCGSNANPFLSLMVVTFFRKQYIWAREAHAA